MYWLQYILFAGQRYPLFEKPGPDQLQTNREPNLESYTNGLILSNLPNEK